MAFVPEPQSATAYEPTLAQLLATEARVPAIHRLFRFPARLHHRVARHLIANFSSEGQTVYDPFVGSGTTIVESISVDRHALGSDVDPLAIFLSRTKRELVTRHFSPQQVDEAVEALLRRIAWSEAGLCAAVMDALHTLDERASSFARTVSMIAGTRAVEFKEVSRDALVSAVDRLASASKGGLVRRDDTLVISVSLEELDRRTAEVTGRRMVRRRRGWQPGAIGGTGEEPA
jgi:hypothetical protein